MFEYGYDTPELPGYDFMIYVRHHGFPSPLLDWTSSPNEISLKTFEEFEEKIWAEFESAKERAKKGSLGYTSDLLFR